MYFVSPSPQNIFTDILHSDRMQPWLQSNSGFNDSWIEETQFLSLWTVGIYPPNNSPRRL